MSGKYKKVLSYKAKGIDIEIIDTDMFFELLEQCRCSMICTLMYERAKNDETAERETGS